MNYLEQVQYKLPDTNSEFISKFLGYLSPLGKVNRNEIALHSSYDGFLPVTTFLFTQVKIPQVSFILRDENIITIDICNTTKESKTSPHQYSHIPLKDFLKRVAPFKLQYIDHTGFNLPFFDGIHPQILDLREKLKEVCLYHTFPKHLETAPWDFILPGTEEEIKREIEINYSLNRKPKIEIVSFEKSSTPLIQLDIQIEGKYKDWRDIFPEAIDVPGMKNLWIYIENDFGIDICFVLNEREDKDWSYHFVNDRVL